MHIQVKSDCEEICFPVQWIDWYWMNNTLSADKSVWNEWKLHALTKIWLPSILAVGYEVSNSLAFDILDAWIWLVVRF